MKPNQNLEVTKQARHISDDPSLGVSPSTPGEVGPNGFPVGYNEDGDKVEWIFLREEEGSEEPVDFYSNILRRNDAAIRREYNDLSARVWWGRHQVFVQKLVECEGTLSAEKEQLLAQSKIAAKKIEDRVGKENLVWDGTEWGLLMGRMSALAWVLGDEWEDSLDT